MMRMENPIYDFIESDNYIIKKKNDAKGVPTYTLDLLVANPKEYLSLCLSINPDFETAKNYYENWDIMDLYEFYTMKLAINYEAK